jgi:hypothetical protein
VVVLPGVLTKVPVPQSLHAVHVEAFDTLLYVPLAHAVHVRSTVALPLAVTRCPGAQSVHAMHSVAELESLSHVPLGHACFVVSPPAQYVPVSHGVHTPGAVRSVPASQPPLAMHVD